MSLIVNVSNFVVVNIFFYFFNFGFGVLENLLLIILLLVVLKCLECYVNFFYYCKGSFGINI